MEILLEIYTPATSANLGPGFDCLGVSLKLYNRVQITPAAQTQVFIKGEGEGDERLVCDNVFVRIFQDSLASLGVKDAKFKFDFDNRIPFSRGLGSSSSVVVGAIAAAHFFATNKAEKRAVLNEALRYENHPDNIAPAALGGFSASVVKGGEVVSQRCEIDPSVKAVVVVPKVTISTEESRKVLPTSLSLQDAVSNLSGAAFVTACFFAKDYASLRFGETDTIHQSRRMSCVEGLVELQKMAYENGALYSTLSGSGSSFLNIVWREDAPRLKQVLQARFEEFAVFECEFDNGGFEILKD